MKIRIRLLIISISTYCFLLQNPVFWQDITSISAIFCNDSIPTENLKISTDSAKTNEICTQFTNTSDKNISIRIWFPDWTITNDSFKNKACKSEWRKEDFWQYVKQNSKTLIVPAHQTITEKNSIRFPAWFSWIVHGCMTYFLDQTNADSTNSVNVVIRQTSYIDVLVGWKFKRDLNLQKFYNTSNRGTNRKINTEFNIDSTISLKLNFVNNWDINEYFEWSWKIYNSLWFSKDFRIWQTQLPANTTKKLSINIGNLPFYWWFFNIQINWNAQPEILFNQNSIDNKLKDQIQITEETTIMVIPWNIIIWIMVFIVTFFLVRYFKK